jgi:hypothetical protein
MFSGHIIGATSRRNEYDVCVCACAVAQARLSAMDTVGRIQAFVIKWSQALLAIAAIYAVIITLLFVLIRRLPTRGALSDKAQLSEVCVLPDIIIILIVRILASVTSST